MANKITDHALDLHMAEFYLERGDHITALGIIERVKCDLMAQSPIKPTVVGGWLDLPASAS